MGSIKKSDGKIQEISNVIKWYNKKFFGITWKIIIFGIITGVILPICLSYATTQITISQNEKMAQKNLANGYLSDLDYVNQTLSKYLAGYNDPNNMAYHRTSKWNSPIYPDWGLYYSNRQDISKFDPVLSQKMYKFYYKLLTAETERKRYNNWEIDNPFTPPTTELVKNEEDAKVTLFNDMVGLVTECKALLPELKTELTKAANS